MIAVFTYTIVGHGVPTLRHDWYWPSQPAETLSFGQDLFYGWLPEGVGRPNPYPSQYLTAVPLVLVAQCFGPAAALTIYLTAIGFAICQAVSVCARHFALGITATIACQLFALFNPWVYTEVVAGHLAMVLSYGGLLWFATACVCDLGETAQSISLALIVSQLQFFVPAVMAALVIGVRRGSWLLVTSALIFSLPAVIGITGNIGPLLMMDYTLQWQTAQSIPLNLGLLLSGYFTGYDQAAWLPFAIGMGLIVALIAVSTVLARSRVLVLCVLVGTLAAAILAAGLKGPLAVPYRFVVLHVPASGLYRELYDVIAFVAVGYQVLLQVSSARRAWVGRFWFAAGLALLVAWCSAPPFRFLVPSTDVPRSTIRPTPNARYALLPVTSPMSFSGRGSGGDPELFGDASLNFTSLNEHFPTYPVDAALGDFTISGKRRTLESLGVAIVARRPWLKVEEGTVQAAFGLEPVETVKRTKRGFVERVMILHADPELTLSPLPRIGALDQDFSARDAFFGDVAGLTGPGVPTTWRELATVRVVQASNRCAFANCDWIAAGLIFAELPGVAQGLGGAYTTSEEPLALPSGKKLLVWIRGSLRDAGGHLVSGSTSGYRWVPLQSDGSVTVRCFGTCIVVATGSPPAAVPLEPSPQPFVGVEFRAMTPWLISAVLPAGPTRMLRYTNSFNHGWIAFRGSSVLAHFRADAAFNAWIAPALQRASPIWLCDVTASLQFLAALFGFIWLTWLVCAALKRSIDPVRTIAG